ncbi:MAG TPA: pirin family protein [Thermoanaerobaculia bacterium]|nr:pirin family protein [Thermoanaerobaculia bacterium]
MSNLEARPSPERCPNEPCEGPMLESWPAREEAIGELSIRRALPARRRRTVGPWCFLDRYGPIRFSEGKPMDVAPHPHIGLQTVSWLLDGEVLHRDSLGFEQLVRPGELNLMTAGRGIAHSEETPEASSGRLSGVQLWIAQPGASREGEPAFHHHAALPRVERDGVRATVILGELAGERSPAALFSPLVGAELRLEGAAETALPLEPRFEHALFVLDGSASLAGEDLAPDTLHFLGSRRDHVALAGRGPACLLLIGGLPLGEPILMWWNFVARTHEEIADAREAWERGEARFGAVARYRWPRLDAPPLRAKAKPNPAS